MQNMFGIVPGSPRVFLFLSMDKLEGNSNRQQQP
jgi:hypothetical protein